jgi:hypothetical protein
MLTPAQIEETDALEESLPQCSGWIFSPDGHGYGGTVHEGTRFVCQCAAGVDEYGRFVAASRTFIPLAIETLRAQSAEIERLREVFRSAWLNLKRHNEECEQPRCKRCAAVDALAECGFVDRSGGTDASL